MIGEVGAVSPPLALARHSPRVGPQSPSRPRLFDLERLFVWTRPVRGLPVFARYLLATLVIFLVCALRIACERVMGGYPFLLFFPAIIMISLVLDRGTGVFAVLLSALLAWIFFMEARKGYRLDGAAQVVPLALYVLVGLFLAGVIEALRITANRVHEAKLELERAAGLNRILLADMNHRVKNHLLSVTSLLRLSTRKISDPAAREAIEETAGRIDVLGKVYNRLHLGEKATVVSSRDFITSLVDDLKAGVIGVRPIALRCQTEEVEFSSGQAVAVGLVINETVQNALKYAFPDERRGEIAVRFEREGARYCLSVADDGVGLPADWKPNSGSKLVRSLAQQLGGELRLFGPPGVRVELAFPVTPPT